MTTSSELKNRRNLLKFGSDRSLEQFHRTNLKIAAWPAYSYREKNPYTSLLYEAIEEGGEVQISEFKVRQALAQPYDLLHVHWPDIVLKGVPIWKAYVYVIKLFLVFSWLKLRGTKLIWTIHNLKSHEQNFPLLEHWFMSWFIDCVDGVIALSRPALMAAVECYPKLHCKPSVVTPHGHYKTIYPNHINQVESRKTFNLQETGDFVCLFLGQIRTYKNVPHLIHCFRSLNQENIRLIVAGKPDSETLKQCLIEAAGGDRRIQLNLEFIPDQDVQRFMNAADLVVLPYQEILNSGSAVLALSFNKPLLVPDRGSFIDLKASVGQDWLLTYTGELTATDLEQAVQWATGKNRSTAPLSNLEWDTIAQQTIQFYRQVLMPTPMVQESCNG
ncbi:MAG: glycosyltransferase [Cyanobacteria bacterium P01_D01_bin.56]